MDILIIGAGLSGAVVANKFANAGKKVVILEKRDHIGGNVFDHKIDGITVQKYGPHIFHTSDEKVHDFISEFTTLNDFVNKVDVNIGGVVTPLPFNFRGIDKFWPEDAEYIKSKLTSKYGKDKRVSIMELIDAEDEKLNEVAKFIYDNIFENYTVKMWGMPIEEVDPAVLKRVPVTIGYGERYFSDKYEGVPKGGFTAMVEKMLDHENIELTTGIDAVGELDKVDELVYYKSRRVNCPIIYTGSLDEFFQYKFGPLNYRSLRIDFEEMAVTDYQTTAVVNHPAHPRMTRVSEYKKFYFEEVDKFTILSKEYPGQFELNHPEFGVRYYPLPTDQDRDAHDKYLQLVDNFKNIYPLGRLAEYKYYNMDVVIANALELSKKLLGE